MWPQKMWSFLWFDNCKLCIPPSIFGVVVSMGKIGKSLGNSTLVLSAIDWVDNSKVGVVEVSNVLSPELIWSSQAK